MKLAYMSQIIATLISSHIKGSLYPPVSIVCSGVQKNKTKNFPVLVQCVTLLGSYSPITEDYIAELFEFKKW